jgi:ribosomal protein S21|tara:strand:- start:35 stop:316 length:282 start_codon:yes stop_codon:yes gene_type:complete
MYKNKSRNIDPLVTVTSEECNGNAEKMIRKFSKKVKRDGILEESRERLRFKKPSVLRTEEKRRRKRLIEKHNKKQSELLSNRDNFSRRKRNKT